MTTLKAIKEAIVEARDGAEKKSSMRWGFVKSRGVGFVVYADDHYDQEIYRATEGEEILSLKLLKELASMEGAKRVCIYGAFDGARNFRDYCDGEYQPCVSEWEIAELDANLDWIVDA